MSGLALLDAPVGKEDSEGGSCCEHSDELYFEESRRGDGKSSDGDDFRLEALFFGVENTRISSSPCAKATASDALLSFAELELPSEGCMACCDRNLWDTVEVEFFEAGDDDENLAASVIVSCIVAALFFASPFSLLVEERSNMNLLEATVPVTMGDMAILFIAMTPLYLAAPTMD